MPPLHGKMVVSRGAGSNHGLPLPPDELIASHPQALGLLNGPGAVCVVVGGLGGRSNRLHRPPRSRAQIRSSIKVAVLFFDKFTFTHSQASLLSMCTHPVESSQK